MLDIFTSKWVSGAFSYPETWWEEQVECWSIPSEQGDFLINMKEWKDAN